MNISISAASQDFLSSQKKQQRPAITKPLKQHNCESNSPATCKKKVVPVPKIQIKNSDKQPVLKGRSSSNDYTSLTPYKATSTNAQSISSNVKTIKKGQSMSNLNLLTTTANKNRHASKVGCSNQQSSIPRKQNPLYGKRKVTVLDEKENDTIEEILTLDEKKDEKSKLKKLKTSTSEIKKEPKHEKIYFMDSSKTKMYCFPMFYEKDLGYNKFIQTTTKETDIDNDCLTDSEVMENVVKWTMDDLDEALIMHREESARDERERKSEENSNSKTSFHSRQEK